MSVARYLQEGTADENLDGLRVHDHNAGTLPAPLREPGQENFGRVCVTAPLVMEAALRAVNQPAELVSGEADAEHDSRGRRYAAAL